MSNQCRVAVIGCGIFGATTALRLDALGFRVTIFERKNDILMGASFNNQNRLHLGFHYPRDFETARQCIQGFKRFVEEFPECISSAFPNGYFIAERGSRTSPGDYLAYCDKLGVGYTPIELADFPVRMKGVATGILCNEVVYDCQILRNLLTTSLHAMPKERHEFHRQQTPMKELVTAEDLAQIIVDLTMPHWRHLNGAVIRINGGS